MIRIRQPEETESPLLTTSPMVQRFVLSTAIVLAGYHSLAILGSGIGTPPGQSKKGAVESTADRNRPLLAVDLNQASTEELALLPGIGPVAAKAIAESRRIDGPFSRVSDLERVYGIGPKTIQAVRPYLRDFAEPDEAAEPIAAVVR